MNREQQYSSGTNHQEGAAGAITWVKPGESVHVHGYKINRGMFYVGKTLPFAIDPTLPIGRPIYLIDRGFLHVSYEGLSPDNRAGYLDWLERGRKCSATVPDEFLQLFFYGVEFRVIFERQFCETLANAIIDLLE